MVYVNKEAKLKINSLPIPFLSKSWSIRTQICCFATFLIFIIFGIAVTACSLILNISLTIFREEFAAILNRTSFNDLSNSLKFQQLLTDHYFHDKITKLVKLNELFHMVQNERFQIEDAYLCFQDNLLKNTNLISNVVCCGYTNNVSHTHPLENGYFFKFSSLLTESYIIYEFNSPFFTSIREDALFGVFNISKTPPSSKTQSIHNRQWYIDHINNMKSGQLILESQPYFSKSQFVSFALSINLTNLENNLIGVGAQNQDLQQIPTLKNKNMKFQMINSNDQLIISPIYTEYHQKIYNITDENISGVSQVQWEKLKTGVKNQQFSILQTQDDYLIALIKLKYMQSHILLELDYSDEIKQQNYLLQIISQTQQLILQNGILSTLIITLIILFVQYIFLKIMQQDIYDIMQTTNNKIYQEYFMLKQNTQKIDNSNISYQLYLAYLKLIDNMQSLKQKNEQCINIENIEYPIYYDKSKEIYLSQFYYQIDEIDSYVKQQEEDQKIKQIINIVEQSLKQKINDIYNIQ